MLVGFLALEQGPIHLYMAFNTWAGQWPGVLDGAEISLLDLIILAIYLSLPRGRHSLPFKFSMAFYFIAALLSVFQASVPMAALFYCWQLVRVFFVFTVVTKACADDPRVVPSLLKGIAAGLFLATCQAVWERFGAGVLQAGAGFGHQNIVGSNVALCSLPLLRTAAGRRTRVDYQNGFTRGYLTCGVNHIAWHDCIGRLWVCRVIHNFCSATMDVAEGHDRSNRRNCYCRTCTLCGFVIRATI